jgi:hypothetical protein
MSNRRRPSVVHVAGICGSLSCGALACGSLACGALACGALACGSRARRATCRLAIPRQAGQANVPHNARTRIRPPCESNPRYLPGPR